MLIGHSYKIESDEMNVVLFNKKVSKKTDTVKWVVVGYFSSVKNALEFLVDHEINKTGLKDLETVNKKIDELMTMVKGLQVA